MDEFNSTRNWANDFIKPSKHSKIVFVYPDVAPLVFEAERRVLMKTPSVNIGLDEFFSTFSMPNARYTFSNHVPPNTCLELVQL